MWTADEGESADVSWLKEEVSDDRERVGVVGNEEKYDGVGDAKAMYVGEGS